MTKKELEQQAKEFNVSVEQIKEWRKHIKPFLEFGINYLEHKLSLRDYICLCPLADKYVVYKLQLEEGCEIAQYIKYRLSFCRPKRSGNSNAWWRSNNNGNFYSPSGMAKARIAFCKQQLKLVKP